MTTKTPVMHDRPAGSKTMLATTKTFSSISVNDLQQAKTFYSKTLGIEIAELPEGVELHLAGGARVFAYPKPNHVPATFTILNFRVSDIDKAVDDLTARNV